MKILIVHNSYQVPGGEDEVVKSETRMLMDHGHKVIRYDRSNKELGIFVQFFRNLFGFNIDSQRAYNDVKELIKKEKPDIAHIHNTFYVISRSVYRACREENVPVVQSLHNYRFLCPIAIFWRPAKGVCEECLQSGLQAAVKNKCWKNNRMLSEFLINVVQSYRENDFLKRHVDRFIALNNFSRNKYHDNGFKECRFSIKPQFLEFDPGVSPEKGGYGLYVGGFFAYKGVETLLKAWQQLGLKYHLQLIGDGPLWEPLRKKYASANVEFLGRKKMEETLAYMKRSLFIVVPSECYETGPRVIIEAFACGVPVVGSEIADGGSITGVIEQGITGMLFKSGNHLDLAVKIKSVFENKEKALEMGRNARKEFEAKYTVEKNYPQLITIYEEVLADHGRKHAGA